MMAVALTLANARNADRDLYLFDTYEGITKPTAVDGQHARTTWSERQTASHNTWAYAGLKEVRTNIASTGYPTDRVHYIVGKVEETVPSSAPDSIAILRLDTDWYESTRHELEHLVDRVSPGGVLIIDDYGHWQGARRAVDEFLARTSRPVLLNRVDYTGRIAVLP